MRSHEGKCPTSKSMARVVDGQQPIALLMLENCCPGQAVSNGRDDRHATPHVRRNHTNIQTLGRSEVKDDHTHHHHTYTSEYSNTPVVHALLESREERRIPRAKTRRMVQCTLDKLGCRVCRALTTAIALSLYSGGDGEHLAGLTSQQPTFTSRDPTIICLIAHTSHMMPDDHHMISSHACDTPT